MKQDVAACGLVVLYCVIAACDHTQSATSVVEAKPQEKHNHAIELSGSEAFIVPIKYDGKHPITIELFACPTTITFSNLFSNQQYGGLGISLNEEGYWQLQVHDGGQYRAVLSDQPAVVNKRVHLAAMYDEKNLKLAVDGVLQKDPGRAEPYHDSGRYIFIGADPDKSNRPDHAFQGVIDEARISDIIRYTENFKPEARFSPDSHTIALYHFDEGNGIIANDSSGHNHHATLVGNECWCDALSSQAHARQYQRLLSLLVENRKRLGFTRADLAAKLSRPESFVTGYETGSRVLDVVDFLSVLQVLGSDRDIVITQLKELE